jgi:hypothetical protein
MQIQCSSLIIIRGLIITCLTTKSVILFVPIRLLLVFTLWAFFRSIFLIHNNDTTLVRLRFILYTFLRNLFLQTFSVLRLFVMQTCLFMNNLGLPFIIRRLTVILTQTRLSTFIFLMQSNNCDNCFVFKICIQHIRKQRG